VKNHLLIIDDESDIYEIIKHYIGDTYDLSYANNPSLAYELITKGKFDLLLIDYLMPEKDGIVLLKEIKVQGYLFNTPAIMITSVEDQHILAKAFEAGYSDFIEKPFNKYELSARIRHHISLKSRIETAQQSLIISGRLIDNLEHHILDVEKLKSDLEKENKRLFEISQKKDELLAVTVHDLKIPFSGILGNCQLLLDGYVGKITDEQRASIETIQSSATRLLKLINDILYRARIEAGKIDLFINEIALTTLAEGAIAELRPLIMENNINAEINCPVDLPKVKVDIEKILRVLLNLISNAIKFTPDGGTISISARQIDNNFIEVSVKDNGSGISKDDIPKLFEKFSQAKNYKKEGTGLGLSICKSIVELHHGKIWVESIQGNGSTFFFTLPININFESK